MRVYEVQGVGFTYPATKKKVLDGTTLTVCEGDIVTLLGRNGAGKSTLLNCMLGLLHYQQGDILLSGRPISDLSERQIASIVGYVPQLHVPSFDYTVLEFVVMGCAAQIGLFSRPGEQEYDAAQSAMATMGIDDIADQQYTQISGGQRQQAMVARAIVAQPKVVLFDEPTAHLDFTNQLRVLRIIKDLAARGYAIVFTTHNPDHALLLGGKVALMDDMGKLSVGSAERVLTPDGLKRVYGEDISLEYVEALGRKVCLYPAI